MHETDYREMKSAIDAERAAEVAAAEEKHRLAMEHVEFVWQRFNGGLFKPASPPAREKKSAAPERGSLILGMKTAIKALDVFSVDDIVAYLAKHQPELGSADRKISITSNVSRLNAAGEVEIVKKGARGRLQTYRKTAKFDVETGVPRNLK